MTLEQYKEGVLNILSQEKVDLDTCRSILEKIPQDDLRKMADKDPQFTEGAKTIYFMLVMSQLAK